jgi:hypothetical protein
MTTSGRDGDNFSGRPERRIQIGEFITTEDSPFAQSRPRRPSALDRIELSAVLPNDLEAVDRRRRQETGSAAEGAWMLRNSMKTRRAARDTSQTRVCAQRAQM